MSSRLTLILAGLFLLAALLAGYWGLRLSRPPTPVVAPPSMPLETPSVVETPAVPAQPEPTRSPVVVLRKAVPANTPLTEDDLLIERLQVAPEGAFERLDQVLGRSSARPLPAGSWLDASSFLGGGPLARMIRPDERAVAVAVDDVIGAAGQLNPGDYVDVLLFLREENNNPQASAQVLLPALRVLSVGAQTGLANDGRPAQSAEAFKARRDQQGGSSGTTRTVGLAVPQALASRLMLAAQVGTLRLAVRSADEPLLARYWSGQQADSQVQASSQALYRFSQLSQVPVASPAAVAGSSTMQIIRGAQVGTASNSP